MIVYVTVAFAVPVKVIVAVFPEHIVVVPLIVAVGNGPIVIIADPVNVAVQLGVPELVILTNAYVVLADNAAVVTVALPEPFNATV